MGEYGRFFADEEWRDVKRRVTILVLALVMALVAALMVASVAGAGGVIGNFDHPEKMATVDQTFAVHGAPTLSVGNRNGTITITRGADNQVIIHAIKRAATDDLLNKLNVQLTQDGNKINAQTSGDDYKGFVFFGNSRTRVDFEIQVPAHTDILPAKSSNGKIEVTGIAGQFDLNTSNGVITAQDVDGTVKAETSNGRVTVSGGRGVLNLRTSNGIVEVQNVQAQGLDLESSNGRVSFTGSLAPGSKNYMETSNGTVNISLPPESALSVDLRSGNGSIKVGFPVTTNPQGENKRNSVQGVINRPDADLSVHTGNGSITLTKQGG